jgi:hypothetical protein
VNATEREAGVVAVVLQRLATQRLPRALALKDKVDRGGLLDDYDIAFLGSVLEEAGSLKALAEQHPEHLELVGRFFDLYAHITRKGLENQQRSG